MNNNATHDVPPLAAILEGIAYQDRFFWLHAPRLLADNSPVERIVFEAKETGFDDLWLFYNRPINSSGRAITAKFFQCKWHKRANGSLGYKSLSDPNFIGTKHNSVLTYARKYREEQKPPSSAAEYIFVTPWIIDPKDVLAELYLNGTTGIDLKKLNSINAPAKIRTARDCWKQALGITSNADLAELLEPVRIWPGNLNTPILNDALNAQMVNCGMVPLDDASNADLYSSHYQNLMKQGRTEFTKETFREYCAQNNLLDSRSCQPKENARPAQRTIGIRSFLRFAENIEDETDEHLCLLHLFERRYINKSGDWNDAVLPALENFLSDHIDSAARLRLLLDAHSSIAFACGSIIGSKPGGPVTLRQKTRGRSIDWSANADTGTANDLQIIRHTDGQKGSDVVLCLSITHEIVPEVLRYLEAAGQDEPTIVEFKIADGAGQSAIRDSSHAIAIAERISHEAKALSVAANRPTIHIFSACPNALLFFVGQLRRAFGRVQLYEYDFDNEAGGTYSPSIMIG